MTKVCSIIVTYNEEERDTLRKTLDNFKQYSDWIVAFDDKSTDNTVEVLKEYTDHVIVAENNIGFPTVQHKQEILDYIKENEQINPDWIVWLDADEIFDRKGTENLKQILEKVPNDVGSLSIHTVNLWCSNCYKRLDTLFDLGWYYKVWRYHNGLDMADTRQLHCPGHPINMGNKTLRVDFETIHFGFADENQLIKKIKHYNSLDNIDLYNRSKVPFILEKYELSNYPDQSRPKKEDKRPVQRSEEEWKKLVE